jgi:hypothetical protein
MVCDALIDHDGHMSGSATNSIVRRVWNQAPTSFADAAFPHPPARLVAVNCRNQRRRREQLTCLRRGLIMENAWSKVAAARAGIGAILAGLP